MIGRQSLQALNDQLHPDALTLEEWRRAQAQERCDSSLATSDDTPSRSNEHPTTEEPPERRPGHRDPEPGAGHR